MYHVVVFNPGKPQISQRRTCVYNTRAAAWKWLHQTRAVKCEDQATRSITQSLTTPRMIKSAAVTCQLRNLVFGHCFRAPARWVVRPPEATFCFIDNTISVFLVDGEYLRQGIVFLCSPGSGFPEHRSCHVSRDRGRRPIMQRIFSTDRTFRIIRGDSVWTFVLF